MNHLLIKGVRILDPSQKIDEIGDILVLDGIIQKKGTPIPKGVKPLEIDGAGLCAAPGFVDIHVHLRDPGLTYKEDILTGAAAAAAGGFTAMCCMPNTKPPIDTPQTVAYILEKAKSAPCKVYPVAAVTKGMAGEELCDMKALAKAGAKGFSDDGKPVFNAHLMQQAMAQADKLHLTIASHCEDMDIIQDGIINKGEVSRELKVPGMDRTSEDSITAREIALSAATGHPVHICHVSTKGSVELIRDAKRRGVPVTGETAPHYLHFTEKKLLKRDASFRMNPPLRCDQDKAALIEALADGTLEAIATDHAPHSTEEKADFLTAPNGVVGLETSFAAAYTALVKNRTITLSRLISLMSENPCRIMKLPGGTLKPGTDGDIVVFDPEERWVVDKEKFHSKGRNTPFHGETLYGKIKYTFLKGKMTYTDGKQEA